MTESGLGAHWDGDGVSFRLFSSRAEAIELCLFDGDGREARRITLEAGSGGIWHTRVQGCGPGQYYGYRVHGPYAPSQGLRFNSAKLLLDPYARALGGRLDWNVAVFDFEPGAEAGDFRINTRDSAPYVPKSVVTAGTGLAPRPGPRIPWAQTIVYEANVRGYTMRHPEVPESERGTFRGMRNGAVLEYLRALGITSVELMPVHAFIDEAFLERRGLRNFWGYNTIGFFAPENRYGHADPAAEFVEMVNAIHEAGLEVILDVVYNHTGESDARGPTLSFRGIDNLAYYRTETGDPGAYVNHTGCGNTLNADHPAVQDLVLDSLRHWHREMGVDGFRFDIATVLGRDGTGFDPQHPLLARIGQDPGLRGVKLIAEPWDVGPGGYQLGRFPPPWAAWNDRFRDSARRFWRGDAHEAGELARRLHGSADLFEPSGQGPFSGINFVTAHDGFTLADLVSYEQRHNLANGERNLDGHAHNFSANHGAEGTTDDEQINSLRRRQRLNLLATLLLSQGTPMLLAGDEFGNSQDGNNNAYCQDNETGWLDREGLERDPGFTDLVRGLIRLRHETPLLRQASFVHGAGPGQNGWRNIEWLHPEGHPMEPADWAQAQAFTMALTDGHDVVALLFNASAAGVHFRLPESLAPRWQVCFTSQETGLAPGATPGQFTLIGQSMACLQARAG
jgi:glycogen operon protein